MKTFIKKKAGPTLGFRTPDFFKGSRFSQRQSQAKGRFASASFKTQHKGG